ncbi:MAG TPA: alpha/beta hydrolase [Pyrinomonadaceae bacterium]|jgi:pimeloyl-ACP methyl ester carboxylesterase|nr:alpha/beta hydrolase [Pyrinomonadaceae bacterium]
MASVKKLFRSFLKLILPVAIFLIVAGIGTSVWLAHVSSNPPHSQYLVTPEQYGRLSTRGARITDESWSNSDGTGAKGWLLRGGENLPAVILLHRYGTDRSWMLNLGVKINEQTNFTVLMPEQRGHGENFEKETTTFGVCEADDIASAVKFLRDVKSNSGIALIGQSIGVYGLEMGAYAAMSGAASMPEIKTLVLDSVPMKADDLISSVVKNRFPFAGSVTGLLAARGNRLYHNACYREASLCQQVEGLNGRQILLLSGSDATQWRASTLELSQCLPKQNKVEAKLDLAQSGLGAINTKPEEADLYDQRVIDFFQQNLK